MDILLSHNEIDRTFKYTKKIVINSKTYLKIQFKLKDV